MGEVGGEGYELVELRPAKVGEERGEYEGEEIEVLWLRPGKLSIIICPGYPAAAAPEAVDWEARASAFLQRSEQ
jgi:hypothetical protein